MSRAVNWELLCLGRGAEPIAKVVGRKEGMGEGVTMRAHCLAQVLCDGPRVGTRESAQLVGGRESESRESEEQKQENTSWFAEDSRRTRHE